MSNVVNIEVHGTLLSEFSELHGDLASYSCNAEEDCKVLVRSKRPMILYSRQHSNILVKKEKKTYKLSPNNFLILDGGEVSIEKLTPSWQASIISPSTALVKKTNQIYQLDGDVLNEILKKDLVLPRKNWLNEILHRFYFAKSVEKIPDNYAINFLELEIVKEVYYSYLSTIDSEQRDIFPADDLLIRKFHPALEECILYIENHLFTELTLEKLADIADCSPRTLQRLFVKHAKKNIRQYILDRKLQEAHLMLRSTNYSVGEVASVIGYESVSTFINLFKRKFGETPGQVIKEYRK